MKKDCPIHQTNEEIIANAQRHCLTKTFPKFSLMEEFIN